MTITFAIVTLLVLAAAGKAARTSASVLQAREHRQVARLHADRGSLRFCRNHPRARVFCTPRRLRFLRARVRWVSRELAETRALLRPPDTSAAALAWKPDPGWLRAAMCIHNHESTDWHRRWIDWAGRPSSYAGGMQFMQSTWANAGGRGEPWQWSPREQLYRTWLVWRADGGSFREWGTAGACGLR